MLLKKLLASALVAGALTAGAAVPANAASLTIEFGNVQDVQWRRHHDDDRLSQREARRILRRAGFDEIRFIDARGRTYRARAEDRRGRDVIVEISARSGRIIDVDYPKRRHRPR